MLRYLAATALIGALGLAATPAAMAGAFAAAAIRILSVRLNWKAPKAPRRRD